MRRFTLETVLGTKEVQCDDFDESDPKEYWFTCYNKPRLVVQKAHVISIQEQPPPDPRLRAWFEAQSVKMRKLRASYNLDYPDQHRARNR